MQLFFCRFEDNANTVYHDVYDDLERFSESDIRQFICEEEKDLSKGPFILVTPLFRDYQITGKNDGRMSYQSVIRETMALRDQIKKCLAGLEKNLYLSSFSIDPDDLIFGQIRVCVDKSGPVLPVLLVADTDDLSRDLLIFPDHDFHGEKISTEAGTFL